MRNLLLPAEFVPRSKPPGGTTYLYVGNEEFKKVRYFLLYGSAYYDKTQLHLQCEVTDPQ